MWSHTVVLVATKFGRTVAAKGTGVTDHGTGSAAMLLGGAETLGLEPQQAARVSFPGSASRTPTSRLLNS